MKRRQRGEARRKGRRDKKEKFEGMCFFFGLCLRTRMRWMGRNANPNPAQEGNQAPPPAFCLPPLLCYVPIYRPPLLLPSHFITTPHAYAFLDSLASSIKPSSLHLYSTKSILLFLTTPYSFAYNTNNIYVAHYS